MNMRIGHGYDVHRLVKNRDLILGGVNIPHHLGLLGHSDADVLLHAISDSLLGSLALGDIGKHFPDTDEQYKGADSLELLACVYELVKAKGLENRVFYTGVFEDWIETVKNNSSIPFFINYTPSVKKISFQT